MDIKGIFSNRQLTEAQQPTETTAEQTPIQSEGISATSDSLEQADAKTMLTDIFRTVAQESNSDLSQVTEKQKQLLEQKEKLHEIQDKLQQLKDQGNGSFFNDVASFVTGNDPGVENSDISSKLTVDAGLRADLGNLLFPLDAMHGQPKTYDDLQQVIRDLQNLLNSTQIPNEEKLKLQAELNQLDQISHQMPIQPQNADQNFQDGLQLLATIRSELSQYVS